MIRLCQRRAQRFLLFALPASSAGGCEAGLGDSPPEETLFFSLFPASGCGVSPPLSLAFSPGCMEGEGTSAEDCTEASILPDGEGRSMLWPDASEAGSICGEGAESAFAEDGISICSEGCGAAEV